MQPTDNRQPVSTDELCKSHALTMQDIMQKTRETQISIEALNRTIRKAKGR